MFTMIEIRQFPCLQDNYGFLVRDRETGTVATIDTPDPAAIDSALDKEGWRLDMILNTHWHPDHASGNIALKKKWGCWIIGPVGEAAKIPGLDQSVDEGDIVRLGESKALVRATPGHTLGHIIYHFGKDGAAFVGDTIFAIGCGRLFEGTPEEMWDSLGKIAAMPAETKLYCAHEYTAANARFALSVDECNPLLRERAAEVARLREDNRPTVPTTVGAELATNPFLRAPEIAPALGLKGLAPAEAFGEIRRRKDRF